MSIFFIIHVFEFLVFVFFSSCASVALLFNLQENLERTVFFAIESIIFAFVFVFVFCPPMNLCFLHVCICVYLHVQQSASLFKQRGVFLAIRFTRCWSTPPLLLYCRPCLRIADGFFTFYLSRPESVRSAFSPD